MLTCFETTGGYIRNRQIRKNVFGPHKENRRVVYSQLMIKGTLLKHVSQIDKHARQFYDNLMKDFAKDAPPMENQMEWVGYMNNARHSAEEIVMKEFIFEE